MPTGTIDRSILEISITISKKVKYVSIINIQERNMTDFVIKIYSVDLNHRGKVRDLCKEMKKMIKVTKIDRKKKFLVFQPGSHDLSRITCWSHDCLSYLRAC